MSRKPSTGREKTDLGCVLAQCSVLIFRTNRMTSMTIEKLEHGFTIARHFFSTVKLWIKLWLTAGGAVYAASWKSAGELAKYVLTLVMLNA